MATPFKLKPGYITKPALLKIAKTEAPWLTNQDKEEIIADLCGKHQELVQSYTATKKAFAPEFVIKFRAEFGEGAVPLTKEEKENPFGPDYVSVKELARRWKTTSPAILGEMGNRGIGKGADKVKVHDKKGSFVHKSLVEKLRFHFVPDLRDMPAARSVLGGRKPDLEMYDTFAR